MTGDPAAREPRLPGGGWRIGRYRVEAVLGTGAFATVYRAVDERLDDTVAVKVLAENHSLDPELRKRFLTEGRVLRRIDSPHVVDVHDLGETDRQQPYLVLEHAARGTLAERARELRAAGWRPTPADLGAVAEPLARALDAIHRAGVVHRDVNPANVLLTTRGVTGELRRRASVVRDDERLLLADLGLCKDLALHSGHTSAGGTEGFRPPELRGGPAIIDGRADLWSLSALLLWLATGTPPDGTPLDALTFRTGLPAGLAEVLGRSLADDPHARHPDARTWLSEVETALTRSNLGTMPGATRSTGGDQWSQDPAPWRSQPPPASGPYAGVALRPPEARDPGRADAAPPPASSWRSMPSGAWRPGAVEGERRSWGWRLRHSAWVLPSLALGFATWIGFLYIGLVSGRARWLWAAAAYGAGAVLLLALMVAAPADANGRIADDSWHLNVITGALLILWPGGFVHALLANRFWLRWRATDPDR